MATSLISYGSLVFADDPTSTPTPDPSQVITDQNTNTGSDSTNQNTTTTTDDQTNNISNDNSNTGTESNNQNTQNLAEPDASVTSTTNADSSTTTNLNVDTGTNSVAHSSLINDFATGNIEGQIAVVKSEANSLAPDSQIQIKTASSDNEVNAADFNSMDSTFSIGNGQTTQGESNQFYNLNSEDKMNLDLNTGTNQFDQNTIIDHVTTGNIDFATNLLNLFALNDPELLLNLQVYSILGDLDGNIVVDNATTNEDPSVTAFSSEGQAQTQTSTENNTNFLMNTGENTLSQNTYAGDISSGDAAAGYFQSDFAGLLSKENFYIINVLGNWTGTNQLAGHDNIFVNIMPPAPMDAIVTAQTAGDQDQNVVMNTDSSLTANANTGRNSFNQNTVVGGLDTGHINLLENVVNLKNTLISLKKKLNIRIINILGCWRGNVVEAQTPVTPPTCKESNTCPVTPSNPPENQNPPAEQIVPTRQNQVLAVSEHSEQVNPATQVLAASTNQAINPANIVTGPSVSYLAYLLLLIPGLGLARLLKKF